MTPFTTFLVLVGAIAMELLTSQRLLSTLAPEVRVSAPSCQSISACRVLFSCPIDTCHPSEAPPPTTAQPQRPSTCDSSIISHLTNWSPNELHTSEHPTSGIPASTHQDVPVTLPAWASWPALACSDSTLARVPTSLPSVALLTHAVSPAYIVDGCSADASGTVTCSWPSPPSVAGTSSEHPDVSDVGAPLLDEPISASLLDEPVIANETAIEESPASPPTVLETQSADAPEEQQPTAAHPAAVHTLQQWAAAATEAAASALQSIVTNKQVSRLYRAVTATSPAVLVAMAAATVTALGITLYLLLARPQRHSSSTCSNRLRLPASAPRVSFSDLQAAAIAALPISPLRLLVAAVSPAPSPRDASALEQQQATDDSGADCHSQPERIPLDTDVDSQRDTGSDQNATHTPLVAQAKARRSAALRAMTDAVMRKTTAAPSPRAPRSSRAALKSAALDDLVDSPVAYGGDVAPSPAGGRVLRVRNAVRYS